MMLTSSDSLNLADLCVQLQVTPPWVGKALQQLNFERKGRGRERLFSRDEVSILRNVKMLRLCGVSWEELKEIRKREQKTKRELDQYYAQSVKDTVASLPTGDVIEMQVGFVLAEPYRFRVSNNVLKSGKEAPTREEVLDWVRRITDKSTLQDVKREMLKKIEEFQRDLANIRRSASKFYKPASERDDEIIKEERRMRLERTIRDSKAGS